MSNPSYLRDQKLISDLQQKIAKATRDVLAQQRRVNPAYNEFEIFPQNNIYRRKRYSQTAIIKELAGQLTYGANAQRSQKELTALVQQRFPGQVISPSIWNKEFKGAQRGIVAKRINSNLQTPISLGACKSLSDIKKAIAAQRIKAVGDLTFKLNITLSSEKVLIAKKVYPIIKRKSGEYVYPSIKVQVGAKSQWLRLDIIKALRD